VNDTEATPEASEAVTETVTVVGYDEVYVGGCLQMPEPPLTTVRSPTDAVTEPIVGPPTSKTTSHVKRWMVYS
jgi:hypothetical protein